MPGNGGQSYLPPIRRSRSVFSTTTRTESHRPSTRTTALLGSQPVSTHRYYIWRAGPEYDPYDLSTLRSFVQTGSVSLTELAWREGLPAWIPLEKVPKFQTPSTSPSGGT